MSTHQKVLEQAQFIHSVVERLKVRMVARAHAAQVQSDCLELTVPQMNLLMALRLRGPMTIKEIAEAGGVSSPSASTMVDRLVEMGAVTREPSPRDRRSVVVSISPEGLRSMEAMQDSILHSIVDLLERVGPEYAAKWCDVYERLDEVMDDDAPSARGGMDAQEVGK